MADHRPPVTRWATAEATRIRDWQSRTAGQIQSAVRDLQEKLRAAGESNLRAIGSLLAQRAGLRVSVEEHDVRVQAAASNSDRESRLAERDELLYLLASKHLRPCSLDRLTRWSRLVDLEELQGVESKRPPADSSAELAHYPHYIRPPSHVIATTGRKLERCRDMLHNDPGSLAMLVSEVGVVRSMRSSITP